mgnify:CR=1 FL=1
MAKEVVVKASTIAKRKKRYQKTKLTISIVLLILIFSFIILSVIYKGGRFTITLDPRLSTDNRIVIYEDNEIKESKRKLVARDLDFMDNISYKWIPNDIDNMGDGGHNGDNYIAYTFYIENQGTEVVHYWYQITIDDVIRNVDEAVRIMIIHNGERKIYAKVNSSTGKAEEDSVLFYDNKIPVLEEREKFAPGDVDKFTIVVWLEGDDPDCVNALIGGEIKMHMDITEEHIKQG